MSEPLTTADRRRFRGLQAAVFQHPLDRQATDALKRMKGFDFIVGKFVEFGIERIEYARNCGGAVRVGPRQLPRLYAMLREACDILDVAEPELYLQVGPLNAYTSGHKAPFIVLQTNLVEVMEDDEVLAVIAHELGHVKCGHVLYKAMARMIGPFFELLGDATLGLGKLVGAGFEAALMAWDRRSELSADRAAMLVTQDASPCVRMLMKLAGGNSRLALDPEQFLNQSRTFQEGMDQRMTDRFFRWLAAGGLSHPFSVERARAIDDWAASPEWRRILAGDLTLPGAEGVGRCCPRCRQPQASDARFCAACGTPLAPV